MDASGPNWLHSLLGKGGAPPVPALDSERIKALMARALTRPDTLDPVEIQELAAAAVAHLVAHKQGPSG